MNADGRHDGIQENLPAFILNGLGREETREVEDHLRGCERCRRELAAYGPMPDMLNLDARDAPLPEGARERLMERTSNVHALRPPGEQSRSPSRRPARLPWMLAAASLLAALLLGGGLLQQSRQVTEQQATITSVVDLMERADLKVQAPPTPESGARVRVYEAREGDVGMVVFDKLPRPPEGQEYQLWMGHGDRMDNEGTFVPTDPERGSYHKLLSPPQGFAEYDYVGISKVPEGGTGKPPPASDPNWVVQTKL